MLVVNIATKENFAEIINWTVIDDPGEQHNCLRVLFHNRNVSNHNSVSDPGAPECKVQNGSSHSIALINIKLNQ